MDPIPLTIAFLAGILLGGFFFGGLWWTVRRLARVRYALAFYFGSLILRLGVVLLTFYVVLVYYGWRELTACLAGFIGIRLVLMGRLGREMSAESSVKKAV